MAIAEGRRPAEGLRGAATAGALAIALLLAVFALDIGGLAFATREAVFDRFIGWFPRSGPSSDVIAVDIDRETLDKFGAWPWRRAQIAEIVAKAAAARPRAIALDILLDGADRNGPRAVISRIAEAEKRSELADMAKAFPDEDGLVASALDKGVPVVLGLGISARSSSLNFPPLVLATAKDAPVDLLPMRLSGLSGPPAALADAAAGLGVLSLDIDTDGWLRRFPLLFDIADPVAGKVHAGFALETVRAAEGAGTVIFDPATETLEAGALKITMPRNALARFYPREQSYWTTRTVPAWRVLAGGLPSIGENTIVVIGSSAPEAGAYLPAAVAGPSSTLRLQAEAIDLLRSGVALKRAPFAPWGEWALALAAGLLAILAAVYLPPLALAGALSALVAAGFAASLVAFLKAQMLFDFVPAATAAISAGAAASLSVYSRVRANRALVEARFARYLAPAVVDMLARHPERLRIAPQRREVTALFTDLEGFTSFGERTPPAQLIETLDEYFEMIAKIAVDHGGMVDKIVGDAVHVFFNMPLDQADHAQRAVACARSIHVAMEDFRHREKQVALGLGRTRIGVDTGQATVGDVGGRNKLDYTAHGEAVNRAARLQSLARDFESGVLIGEGTARKLASMDGLKLAGNVTPRGLTQEQPVYTFA